ncbi:MAG: exodeoxyribonuclease VII large subunit [Sphingomonadaceae bacterium]|nr:exodeoxyribonuclease VII large subunit [Sphingomonadaceae bacterium]
MATAAPLGPTGNVPEYSVSELAQSLRRTVEETYSYVRVRGELSGFKRHSSGHCYFCLKDEGAALDAVLWRTKAGALSFRPEDGLEVIATGRLSTYADRSKYQIVVERLEPAGVGALLAQLEKRKAALAAEGLFEQARKRPIPFLPQVIGVVTSPTGAVIRDILHRLAERFPRRVIVWPVPVQGEGSAEKVAAAVRGLNALPPGMPRPDLIIVARGGGSIEDLWGFNDEAVVRAVAGSAIPVISAVGHETDTTLCDLAADLRAPTPTAAAEKAVPVRADLIAQVASFGARLERCVRAHRTRAAERTHALVCRLPRPEALLALRRQRLDDLTARLPRGLDRAAERGRTRLTGAARTLTPALLARRRELAANGLALARAALARGAAARTRAAAHALERCAGTLRPALLTRRAAAARAALQSEARALAVLSPLATLGRGYAVVERPDGHVLPSAAEACGAGRVRIRFSDGRVEADIAGSVREKRVAAAPPPVAAAQETLF